MDRIAQRLRRRTLYAHQEERAELLKSVAALATVGRTPTREEYVIYHCFTFVQGDRPLAYGDWVASLTGERNAMDAAIPEPVP